MVNKSHKSSKKKSSKLQHAHKLHIIYGVAIIAVLLILIFAFVLYGSATGEAYRSRAAYYSATSGQSNTNQINTVPQNIPKLNTINTAQNQLATLDSKDMKTVSEIKQKFNALGGLGKVMVKQEICEICPTCFEDDAGIDYLIGSKTIEHIKGKGTVVGQDECIPGSGNSGAMIKEYYCENGAMKMKIGKCADTGAGTSCNAEKTACAPECTSPSDCKNNEICINTQCQNIFTEIKCKGDNSIVQYPKLLFNVDTGKVGETYLMFGNQMITPEELEKSMKKLSLYGAMKQKASYPFKDYCQDSNTVIELVCDNYWAGNILNSLLGFKIDKFPNNGGTYILPRKYICPKGTTCIKGACSFPKATKPR